MSVVLLVPEKLEVGSITAEVRRYVTAGDLRLRIRELGASKAVLYHDGFSSSDQVTIAAAVRESGATCIEVRASRWDGFEPSPLSSACTGVIAGFGAAALAQAVAAISG